jgi:putative transposase
MSSYRQHLYHIVFRTKNSLPTIKQDNVNELYSYIVGIVKNKNSYLYRINGVENHLHILTDMHPSIAPMDFMRDVKVSTSLWMKSSGLFPAFKGWAEGYGSFTCSYNDLGRLVEYIKNQQEHHKKITFEEEYRSRTPSWRWGLFKFGSFRAVMNKIFNVLYVWFLPRCV